MINGKINDRINVIELSEPDARKAVDELGMWIFLGSELLFFGGLFLGYFVYRFCYPDGFTAGGRESDWTLGMANTLILITSSFFMAAAVEASRQEAKRRTLGCLFLVGLLGTLFLLVKAHEYLEKFHHHLYPGGSFLPGQHPPEGMSIFFSFYFVMTGFHAVHLMVGLGLLIWMTIRVLKAQSLSDSALRLDIFGLYWHFIDMIWIFLFPLFYLVGRHS